jgi:SAM-dependent methyltransferase
MCLRASTGEVVALDRDRWYRSCSRPEAELLARMRGPVLDVGCGPGRLVTHLVDAGVPAIGVDEAPGAVAEARRRGAPVLRRSVWDPIPGTGRYRSVLLFDGNVGIGGDPAALLARCHALTGRAGEILVELEAPGAGSGTHRVRLERGSARSPWFSWALVAVDRIDPLAAAAGLTVRWRRRVDDGADERWFALLSPPGPHLVVG